MRREKAPRKVKTWQRHSSAMNTVALTGVGPSRNWDWSQTMLCNSYLKPDSPRPPAHTQHGTYLVFPQVSAPSSRYDLAAPLFPPCRQSRVPPAWTWRLPLPHVIVQTPRFSQVPALVPSSLCGASSPRVLELNCRPSPLHSSSSTCLSPCVHSHGPGKGSGTARGLYWILSLEPLHPRDRSSSSVE